MKTKATIISLFILFASLLQLSAQTIKPVYSKEVNSIVKANKNITILDVRTPGEYKSGHIMGAVNIDIRQADAANRITALNKKATYLVYCRTNNRSKAVSDFMIQNGFTNIYQMVDGIVGWNANALPLER